MQSLQLADFLFPLTRTGAKCATIRRGRRDIALGRLRLDSVSCTLDPIEVVVERVSYTAYGALTEADWAANGRTDLRQFYPDLADDEEMTVVHYRVPMAIDARRAAIDAAAGRLMVELFGASYSDRGTIAVHDTGKNDGGMDDLHLVVWIYGAWFGEHLTEWEGWKVTWLTDMGQPVALVASGA